MQLLTRRVSVSINDESQADDSFCCHIVIFEANPCSPQMLRIGLICFQAGLHRSGPYVTLVFISLEPDNVDEGIMFSGYPSAAFIRPFVRTDLVTTMSHEQLENSR